MVHSRKNIWIQSSIVGGLLLLAWVLGYLYDGSLYSFRKLLGPLQTLSYIAVIAIWANTVRWRIIQPYVRTCLQFICVVMVLWLSLRSYKFFFAQSDTAVRLLWYSYYIGILFIPMLTLLAAIFIGKGDDYKLEKRYWLMIGFTSLLVGMALTNDLHQFVFAFPADAPVWNDSVHSYNWGYLLIVSWCALCIIASLVLMIAKSKRQRRLFFRWLPFLPLLLLAMYLIAYSIYEVRLLFDLTAMYNLLYILEFECCIQCGLIRSNTGYDLMFANGNHGAQIVDSEGNVLQSSGQAYTLTKEQRKQAIEETIWPEDTIRIRCNPIQNGYVLWKEDVSELQTLLEQLRDNNESIEASVAIEQESYETKRKINSLQEKNRLYDLLQSQTAGQIDLMDSYLEEYDRAQTIEEKQKLLAKLTVIGSYIKRRGNLLFIAEKSAAIDSGELALCIEESFASLRLCSVDCGIDMEKGHPLEAENAFAIYDLFEEIVELTIDDCKSFYIKAKFSAKPVLSVWVESAKDLSVLEKYGCTATREEDMYHLTLAIEPNRTEKGGAFV